MEIILTAKELLKIVQERREQFKLGYTTLEVENIRMTEQGCVLCIKEVDEDD